MKRNLFFYLILMLPWCGYSQIDIASNSAINSQFEKSILADISNGHKVDISRIQLSANNSLDVTESEHLLHTLDNYIIHLKKIKSKSISEKEFLKRIFYKTHNKYLKRYNAYSTFCKTLKKGQYDCLTGTILYSVILDKLGVKHNVIETDYHIFLMIPTSEGNLMFESTDPFQGFVSSENEVNERIKEIRNSQRQLPSDILKYSSTPFEKDVTDLELAGLQYFNASVLALSEDHLIEAIDQLEKACLFYNANRLIEYGKHLVQVLTDSPSVPQEKKQVYLLKLTNFLNEGVVFASN